MLLVFSAVGCRTPHSSNPPENRLEDRSIPVLLPPTARVELKSKQSKSGRLTNIDPVAKHITLTQGNESATVALVDIARIAFQGELELRGKPIAIRGDKNGNPADDNAQVWEVPLTDLSLVDGEAGTAQLKLEAVPDAQFQGIRSVAADNTYVVEELGFESPETVAVRAVPY